MKKKLFLILILPALALVGVWFLKGALATSNPFSWNNGLVGYWSFDGQYTTSTNGTRDVSNNNNWGAFSGGVKPASGVVGQALSFDGVDDYVNMPLAAASGFSGTISAWVKADSFVTLPCIFSSSDTATADYYLRFWILSTGILRVTAYKNATPYGEVGSTNALNTGQWYHVAVTSDGSAYKLYINGVSETLVIESANNGDWFGDISGRDNAVIGSQIRTSQTLQFDGLIDEVRIYSRALSADEVLQHYQQTRRNLVINNPSGTPPVGWWKMDEATGATVRDYSVNANNGTPTGTASVDGKIGKALSFNGTSDLVSITHNNVLNVTDFTIGLWVKYVGAGPAGKDHWGILSKNDGSSLGIKDPFYISLTGPNVSPTPTFNARMSNGTDTGTCGWMETNIPANDGLWHYLVLTRSGTSVVYYVDSISRFTCSLTGTTTNTQPLILGRWTAGYANFFNGYLDDVRIYNYARTADQIASDYRAGAYRTIIGTSVPSTWWTNGLVGYWNFDGQNTTSTNGTRDTSGNNNWGIFNGGVRPIAGIVGQALSFDGVDDYVNAGSGASLQITTAITLEAWVYQKTSASNQFAVVYGSSGSFNYGLVWITATGKMTLGLDVGGWSDKAFSAAIPNNTWVHIVGTYDGSRAKIYRNGILDDDQSLTGSITITGGNSFRVGYAAATSHWWKGSLDEVRIYNRALGADEVMQHYLQTRRNLGL